VLLVGCGDVGLRVAAQLPARVGLTAVTSSPQRRDALRARGIRPLLANLDDPASLRRLAGLATHLVHLAPPPGEGWTDPRTRALMALLRRRPVPGAVVYGSTSGVYGHCNGAGFARPDRCAPTRRAPAGGWTPSRWCASSAGPAGAGAGAAHPGHLRPDREGGTPRARLLKGTPVLRAEDDVYTNHIQADDLARACIAALWRGRAQRVYNVNATTRSSRWVTTSTWRPTCMACPGRRAWRVTDGADRTAADAAEFHVGIAPARQHPP
jgi:nucleoside-diphosphate-sugar epimerase